MKLLTFKNILLVLFFFLFFGGISVSAATLNLLTDKSSFSIGDLFNVDVKIDSEDTAINAAQATIKYPKDTVQIDSFDRSNSIFNFWLQEPTFSNSTGEADFIAGSTSAFSGKSLQVLRIKFKVVGAGSVNINFTDGAVTAGDGTGSNVLSSMKGLQLSSASQVQTTPSQPVQIVRPAVPTGKVPQKPAVLVPLYPNQEEWYNTISGFLARWDLPNDVTDVATELNKNPESIPQKSEGLFDNKNFGSLDDGHWYLHVRFKNNIGWGPTTHYNISIDTIPPLAFGVQSEDGESTENVAPTLSFKTSDQPSGVDFYRIIVDNTPVKDVTDSSFVLPAQNSGKHTVVVQAYDKAGNRSESRLQISIKEKPFITVAGLKITQFWFFFVVIAILIIGFFLGWLSRHFAKKQQLNRIIIAQRDVSAVFGVIKKDIDFIAKKIEDGVASEQEINEMGFALKRINDNITKAKKYLPEGIEEIGD